MAFHVRFPFAAKLRRRRTIGMADLYSNFIPRLYPECCRASRKRRVARSDRPRASTRSVVAETRHELAELGVVDRASRALGLDAGFAEVDHINMFHLTSPCLPHHRGTWDDKRGLRLFELYTNNIQRMFPGYFRTLP